MLTVLFVKYQNWRPLILVFVISMNPNMEVVVRTVMARSVSSQPILVVWSNALSIFRPDSMIIRSLRISLKGQDLIDILLS